MAGRYRFHAEIAEYQARLRKLVITDRRQLRAQGMTEVEIDADIDRMVRALMLRTSPSVVPFPSPDDVSEVTARRKSA